MLLISKWFSQSMAVTDAARRHVPSFYVPFIGQSIDRCMPWGEAGHGEINRNNDYNTTAVPTSKAFEANRGLNSCG